MLNGSKKGVKDITRCARDIQKLVKIGGGRFNRSPC